MFISGSSNHNVGSQVSIRDRYLRIGTFCEYHDMLCLHARNRQDMKEVYLWLYKNRFNDTNKVEQFYAHVKKFLKIKENKIIDYGVDSDGTGYVAIEKSDTTLLANLIYNKVALEKILIKIIELVSKQNSRGIYHGMFTEYSFTIDTEKNVSLIEPFGLNGSEQIVKSSNIDPRYYSLESKSDVYSLGSLIYKLCSREQLPTFYNKEQNLNFIANTLYQKLENKAPNWVENILKNALVWENRVESVKEFKKAITGIGDIRDTAIHEKITEKILFSNFFWPAVILTTVVVCTIFLAPEIHKLSQIQTETNVVNLDLASTRIQNTFNQNNLVVNPSTEQKYQEQKVIINTLKINPEIAPVVEEPQPVKIEPNLNLVSELLRQEDICKNYFVR